MLRYTLFILLVCLAPVLSHADVYQYEDSDGVTHFTNVAPKKKRYQTLYHDRSRKTPSPVKSAAPANVSRFDSAINYHASLYGVDPLLVKAVMKAESNFNPAAVSPKGAQGLMQLMPGTARLMRVENPFDPEENIKGGTGYLRALHNAFGDLDLTLAAYNAGPTRVFENGMQVPPITETKNYIKRVRHYYDQFRQQ